MTWVLASMLGSIREIHCVVIVVLVQTLHTILQCESTSQYYANVVSTSQFTLLNINVMQMYIVVVLPLLVSVCVEVGVGLLVGVSVRTTAG